MKNKNKKMHGREYGVQQYNKLCDIIDIEEDKRIRKNNLDVDREKELKELLDAGIIAEEEREAEREEADYVRESLIKAFRENKITITESDDIELELYDPLKKSDGTVYLDKVKLKKRYQIKEYNNNCKGIKPNDQMSLLTAMMATRIGLSTLVVSQLYDKDKAVIEALVMLFM